MQTFLIPRSKCGRRDNMSSLSYSYCCDFQTKKLFNDICSRSLFLSLIIQCVKRHLPNTGKFLNSTLNNCFYPQVLKWNKSHSSPSLELLEGVVIFQINIHSSTHPSIHPSFLIPAYSFRVSWSLSQLS